VDILADLNDPQRRAVTHIDGPLLVLAGAGSGKTRVITRRVAYMCHRGIPAGKILAITFTNKAAEEMRRRVEELAGTRGATVCTFHSLCARLLREFAVEAKLSTDYTIYDRSDQLRVVKDVMKQLDLPTGNFSPSRVHAAICAAKTDLKTAEQFAAEVSDFYTRNVAKVYRRYEEALAASNALDFDDLLLRMALLLRDRPDVRELLGRRFRYVMIDEYQDTNRAQYILAHGIALDHENICVTGDPDQSIYAWRGADINNILEFEADYPNATVIRLEENYRSTKPILDAASRLIAHNKMRKEKTLWTRRQGGSLVNVVYVDDEHAEAQYVARRIGQYVSTGRRYDEMAVFYRINALSRVIEEAFIRAGIPYRVARGVEFYNRKIIKDVLAYLKVLANPADQLSCLRIINTPPRGIGAATVKRLLSLAERSGGTLLEAIGRADQAGLGPAAIKKVTAFRKLIDSLRAATHDGVQGIIERVISATGLDQALGESQEDQDEARANLAELISTAAEFDQTVGGTLADYLQQVSLVSDVDHFEGASGAVTLMTLHAAKGLEFPVVFIVGCEAGLLPFERADDELGFAAGEKLEEERRLAFVGMTRAKDELNMSCARYRMIRGRTSPQSASPFLTEMGTESVKIDDQTTDRRAAAAPKGRGGFYEDIEDRRLIEAMADAASIPPEYEYMKVGSKVYHPTFGPGQVVQISQPWPETRAKVKFHQCGTKTLLLRLAKLELL